MYVCMYVCMYIVGDGLRVSCECYCVHERNV